VIADDEQTIRALRNAMAGQVRDHRLDPAVTSAALARLDTAASRTRHRIGEYVAVAATFVVVAGVAVGVYAARGSDSSAGGGPRQAANSACSGAVVTSALPEWARAGFSPDAYVNPHVTGASGKIVGVLFVDPLRSPPRSGVGNKILWVAKDPGTGPLVIRARLDGSSQTASSTVAEGPGPSILDLPAPGCWQLTLTWSGQTDSVALPYAP
jgi:hypothetical protein